MYKREGNLPREDQLADKIGVATDTAAGTDEVMEMVINRMIDNASVAIVSLNRAPTVTARAQAPTYETSTGARARRCSASANASQPNGQRGPTAGRSGIWITTTPSWLWTTPTPAITPTARH